jgi:hypothetical protein
MDRHAAKIFRARELKLCSRSGQILDRYDAFKGPILISRFLPSADREDPGENPED